MRRSLNPRDPRLKGPNGTGDKCGPTGKWRYRSEGAAREGIAKAREAAQYDPSRRECRYYECRLCGGWHLTSREFNAA